MAFPSRHNFRYTRGSLVSPTNTPANKLGKIVKITAFLCYYLVFASFFGGLTYLSYHINNLSQPLASIQVSGFFFP